jgi:hypothetical protein
MKKSVVCDSILGVNVLENGGNAMKNKNTYFVCRKILLAFLRRFQFVFSVMQNLPFWNMDDRIYQHHKQTVPYYECYRLLLGYSNFLFNESLFFTKVGVNLVSADFFYRGNNVLI